jgi:tyrosyl-DNA phosphodiesterase 2
MRFSARLSSRRFRFATPTRYYSFQNGQWVSSDDHRPTPSSSSPPSTLKLVTWNIDSYNDDGSIRMGAALEYIEEQLVRNTPPSLPIVIFLQEMVPEYLQQICEASWVRERFHLTDIDEKNWGKNTYGTTTLVDKLLGVQNVFRVRYPSKMGRDGLFVDVAVGVPNRSDAADVKTIRLCNTHLEPFVSKPPLRPSQLAVCARYLRGPSIHGGLVAGDFNAIEHFDRTLHIDNNLTDAYLALGGQEESDEGYTWGYQSSEDEMKKYGPSRMDKVMFCGWVRVEGLERVGVGVKVEERKAAEMKGELRWVTDHYGLMATVEVMAEMKE